MKIYVDPRPKSTNVVTENPNAFERHWHSIQSGIASRLYTQVNIGPLIVLRVVFGLLMFAGTLRSMARGWIRELYVLPQFHFTYAGFDWVRPLPEAGLWIVFITLALLALCITLGFLYRLSMICFFLLFTYVELLDKTYYLNHYYFISLLSFLLIFLPLNGVYALDNRLGLTPTRSLVPAWMVWTVRVQLGLVYFFAGIAKLNSDWLRHGLPLGIWLQARTGTPIIGRSFDTTWLPIVMSWASAFFDLTIFFWLSWRKTRLMAYVAVVVFHGLTGLLFNIGMFPWIMIACTLVFFDWIIRPQLVEDVREEHRLQSILSGIILLIFFGLQLLLPLRHWLTPGNVNWTEQNGRFAWRVMLVEKSGHATFFVRDQAAGREWLVLPSDYLTPFQEQQMSFQPDMLLQFAHFIAAQYKFPVSVRAEAYVSWNGRTSRLLLDPDVDLLHYSQAPVLRE